MTQNAGAAVSDTHTIVITATPPSSVIIRGPTAGLINTAYTFTATVSPPTATQPIVYTWSPPPATGLGTAVNPSEDVLSASPILGSIDIGTALGDGSTILPDAGSI